MKHTTPKLLFIIVSVMLCQSVCPLFVDAATTREIVFTSTRDGNKEIYIMNPDGSKQVNLTRHRADDFDPTWSPDRTQILFVSDRKAKVRDLYLMDADGTDVRRVFRQIEHREQPTWSPDGKRIAYVTPAENAIKIATVTGHAERRLTLTSWGSVNPEWSPDGSEIAYDWKGSGDIRLINVTTKAVSVLLPDLKFVMWYPAWAPTGDKLAFAALKWPKNHDGPLRVDDKLSLYIGDREGAWVEHIVKEPVINYPTWSPDGSEILYEKRFDDARRERQLFKISVEGGKPQQLTSKGSNYQADWLPDISPLPVEPTRSSLTTIWGKMKRE